MLKTKKLKSPLRYPGGKSRAVKIIRKRIPKDVDLVVSPFFGGGSVELDLAQDGIKVIGYDNFKPLAEFWRYLLHKPLPGKACWRSELIEKIQSYYPVEDLQDFKLIQQYFLDQFGMNYAAKFFVLNRSSFSGTTMNGGCTSTPSEGKNARFTQSFIDRLREFERFPKDVLTVNYSDWSDTFGQHLTEFMYLDPPYLIDQSLYGIRGDGQKDFDHLALRDALCLRKGKWLTSYNDCEVIRKLYAKFTIEEVSWSYGMSEDKYKGELLIRNY